MPKFLTIAYGDEAGYNRTPAPMREAAHRHDARLREAGAIIGVAGNPVQIRNPAGHGVQTTPGAFMQSELPIAGFALIDAETLEDAIEQVAHTPCAVAYGVVEIWPLHLMAEPSPPRVFGSVKAM